MRSLRLGVLGLRRADVLEIGQPSGDRGAISIEACNPFADLRLFSGDLVQYGRCCGRQVGLQWFQVDRDDRSCWRLTP
jgi:hypothetical protein